VSDSGSNAGAAASVRSIDVSAGVVFHEGRVLIAKRPEGKHLAGFWEFPGGKREPNETWEQCLTRELVEELGVTVAPGRTIHETTHAYPDRVVRLRFIAARWVSGTPQAIGCADWAWVRCEDLSRYAFPPADAEFLEVLRRQPEMA
jgi:8-oxo-dGTP diphosphatase